MVTGATVAAGVGGGTGAGGEVGEMGGTVGAGPAGSPQARTSIVSATTASVRAAAPKRSLPIRVMVSRAISDKAAASGAAERRRNNGRGRTDQAYDGFRPARTPRQCRAPPLDALLWR